MNNLKKPISGLLSDKPKHDPTTEAVSADFEFWLDCCKVMI